MSTPKDPLQLSTISQAADLLQVNPRTIRRLIDAGPSALAGRSASAAATLNSYSYEQLCSLSPLLELYPLFVKYR